MAAPMKEADKLVAEVAGSVLGGLIGRQEFGQPKLATAAQRAWMVELAVTVAKEIIAKVEATST